ncbi:multipolar spindle 1 [Tasmannia lanceolata]|uniref:multipolar spindle 1 n=1 Tax=Tasmannia lanceolata TaxID=3420 RepID=UPI004062EECD
MDPNPSTCLKLAIAIALLRSKLLLNPDSSQSSAQRWKRKAKERKQELLRLREEIKEIEDGKQYDPSLETVCCKCYFFDNCGKLSPSRLHLGDAEGGFRINEILHRRFLRQVRWKKRKKKSDDSVRQRHTIELNGEDEIERLSTSADFLVELSSTVFHVDNYPQFSTLSHQAVDFILASLKTLLSRKKESELIEEIVSRLIMHLLRRMFNPQERDGSTNSGSDAKSYVQHVIRKLGSEPYVGQRAMLFVSQRISVLADSLVFMDPFDDAFPNMHSCMFMMIQLIEFLISDYTQTWASNEAFENGLFEEWVRSVLQAHKALEALESRNGLYLLYMDRIKGELLKQVDSISRQGILDIDILEALLH